MNTQRFLLIFFLSCAIHLNMVAQEFVPPELEFTCELKVTIDPPIKLGETPRGERIILPISGGTFEGPRLKGTVLRGGADYQYADKKTGRTELEAIYTIRTHDSVYIHVRNIGLIHTPAKQNGSKSDVYFRAAPKFEAPLDSKYAWLNNAIYICKPVPKKDYISIQVWKVL